MAELSSRQQQFAIGAICFGVGLTVGQLLSQAGKGKGGDAQDGSGSIGSGSGRGRGSGSGAAPHPSSAPPVATTEVDQKTVWRHAPGVIYQDLSRLLFGPGKGPFQAPPTIQLPEDHTYPHTNLPNDFIDALFLRVEPTFLLELGSFKGGSALIIADSALRWFERASQGRQQQLDLPCLLCVDTFLGDTAMWLNRNVGWRDWLMLESGLPQLYWQFLANVSRLRDLILPLPLTSLCALRALQELVAKGETPQPSFIYLDSAHEKGEGATPTMFLQGETLIELQQAFRLLAVGGVLVGDDLDWPAVESDLKAFLIEQPELAADQEQDEVLRSLPKLHFSLEGYWILDSNPRQYVLRKKRGVSQAELKAALEVEVNGDAPAEYVPLTEQDREAIRSYDSAVQFAEAGDLKASARLFKKAAAASPSLAAHYGL